MGQKRLGTTHLGISGYPIEFHVFLESFQTIMESLLLVIPNIVLYIDNILITRSTEELHLETL